MGVMTDRKDSWSQLLALLLQAIVPLVVAGGATGILSAFKENLPQSFYVIFLYVIWGVVIAMLIWLVLRLILGDWLNKLRVSITNHRQHRARQILAEQWRDKWLELWQLIARVVEADWQPTDEQKDNYFKRRVWFIKNRAKFLWTWHDFNRQRTVAAHEDEFGSTASLKWQVFRENYKDPFSYFYEPLGIEDLEYILRNRQEDEIRRVLIKLEELMDEFVEWTRLYR